MMRRLFDLLGTEIKGLHEAAYLLAFFAFGSQVLGLVRDRLLASIFGASTTLDIYYAAFRIPDLIFVTVSSLVSVSVLIPFLVDRMNKSNEEGKRFVDAIFTIFFSLIIVISAIVFFFIPFIVNHFFPSIVASGHGDELITMTRILLLSPILLGVSNLFGSITQVYKQFALYAVSPLFYNLGIISGVIFFYPLLGVYGLVWGVVLGALLHALIQIPSLLKAGMLPKLSMKVDMKAIRDVLTLSIPRTFAMGAQQLSTFFLISLASLMTTGSIAIFTFAWNLQSVPMGIIGMSYSLAAFPTIAGLFARGERKAFVEHIGEAFKHIVFWSMPVTVLFIVLRAQIVRVILGAGSFNWSDTRLTAAALAIFAVSVVAQSLLLLITRAYYAASDTKTPLYVNIGCAIGTIFLANIFVHTYGNFAPVQYFFENLLKVEGLTGTVVLMLPLAFSIGAVINLIIHLVSFEKHIGPLFATFSKTLFQSFCASIMMGYVAYVFLGVYDNVFSLSTFWGIFLQGFCAGITGIIAGIVVLHMLKNEEIVQVWKTLHRKIWKAPVIVPDQQEL